MLWTDADFVTAADLYSIDASVADLATDFSLTLEGADGLIRRGIESAGRTLTANLQSFSSGLANSSQLFSSSHLAAVFHPGVYPGQRLRVTPSQIVVSGPVSNYWSAIKRWVASRCLAEVYLAVCSKAEGDRYETKLELLLSREEKDLWPSLKATGIPLVGSPMPCPAAVQENSGSWSASTAALVAGTSIGQFDVAITYVDGVVYVSPTDTKNAESHPSARKTVNLSESGLGITVDLTSLVPPDGTIDKRKAAQGFVQQMNATAYNVWVSERGGTLWLQNASPIPIATRTYALDADPVLSGYAAQEGQWPESYRGVSNTLMRA